MSALQQPANARAVRGFQPVGHVIGRLSAALGLTMFLPVFIDVADGNEAWRGTFVAAGLTIAVGAALAVLTAGDRSRGLTRHQAILLTVSVWVVLPIFGALPFVFGAPSATYTDAFFEAMSGLTTTGATVFDRLNEAPRGMLIWRAMLQWFGGVGIVVVAMVFLPALKIGGMQFFRTESFDLVGDILPRAAEAAAQISSIYLALTIGCMLGYSISGLSPFDAICHAMTTVSTGGLGNYDDSFKSFPPGTQYVAIIFMALAAMPFLRLMQLARGQTRPMLYDSQIRAFLLVILTVASIVTAWLVIENDREFERSVRAALFNVTSILTGTGYASDDFNAWGGFPVALFFVLALIGGCAGSTSCSAKVFRYQILFATLKVQIRRIHAPHGVYPLRYQGRTVEPDVLSSVMGYFLVFVAALVLWAVLLSMLGLDTITAISGSVASLANVGPGLGETIGPAGNYKELPDSAKWLLAAGMLLGRLEFMSVLVLFTRVFWVR